MEANTSDLLREIVSHNVIKNQASDGPALDIGPLKLLWKAQGANTGYSFSIFETTLPPGLGIPLHKHPFPEFFYVLDGNLSFGCWNESGVADWIDCSAGESLLAPPNAPHTFLNRSDKPGRMLSVSTYHHERMLYDAIQPGGTAEALPKEMTKDDFIKVTQRMEQNQCFVVGEHD